MLNLKDTFTDANGTAIASHTPEVGGPWTSPNPGCVIQSNALTGSDATGSCSAPLKGKTARMLATINLNGCDNGTTLQMYIYNNAGGQELTFYVDGTGQLLPTQDDAAGGEIDTHVYSPFVGAGDHKLLMQVTASRCIIALDGVVLVNQPRIFSSALDMDIVLIRIDRAAGTYPLVKDMVITN